MPEGAPPVDPAVFAAGCAVLLGGGLLFAVWRPERVVAHARTVLGLLLATSLLALAALVDLSPPGLRLRIDPSTEPLLPRGDPAIDAYRRAVLAFGDDQVFVIAMECDDVFRAEHLEALRRVTDAISRLDGVRRVRSLTRVTSFRYVPEEDWIEVRPFIEDVPREAAALAALRERALASPIYRRNLVSADGRAAALEVGFREMSDGEFIAADLDGRIRRVLDAESGEGRRFYVSGRPHIKSRMYHGMVRDLTALIPIGLAVVAGVLALAVGRPRGVLLPLATVAVAVLWTFGAIAFLDRPLTVLTVLLAPTLVAIGSVYGVHVLGRWEEELPRGGGPPEVALRTLRHMRLPVGVAGLTTVVGFAALLLTDVPAVFEIGAFSILGIASVTLISLLGLPALLSRLPLPSPGPPPGLAAAVGARLDAALASCAELARRRATPLVLFWLVLSAGALAALPRIEIDTDYLSFFDADTRVRRDFDAINRLLAGAVPLFVVLEGEPGALRDPALLRRIEALQAGIDELPGVSRSMSLLDTLRVLNRAIERDDPAAERVPDSRAAVTELLFMFPKAELARFATVDQGAANVVVRTGEVGSAAVRRLVERIEALLRGDALPAGVERRVTGNAVLLSRAADEVARSQPRTVGLAALAIFALLSLSLRSVRLGAVGMIPNVVPVLLFFGALGLGAAPLSLPTSLIGSVALGIAIDATAHYVVRYRAERAAGASPEEAVRRTTLRVGRPVAIASLMLAAGFASIVASEFATLRQFGTLSAGTLVVCAFTDLLLLPALLLRWRL